MKTWITALLFLVSIVLTAQASPTPATPAPDCGKEIDLVQLFSLPQALPAACPGSFCIDDLDCACSSASTATCGPFGTCVYTYPGGNPGSSPQSGDLCLPGRFCVQPGLPCGSCTQGGQGICAFDGICRVP